MHVYGDRIDQDPYYGSRYNSPDNYANEDHCGNYTSRGSTFDDGRNRDCANGPRGFAPAEPTSPHPRNGGNVRTLHIDDSPPPSHRDRSPGMEQELYSRGMRATYPYDYAPDESPPRDPLDTNAMEEESYSRGMRDQYSMDYGLGGSPPRDPVSTNAMDALSLGSGLRHPAGHRVNEHEMGFDSRSHHPLHFQQAQQTAYPSPPSTPRMVDERDSHDVAPRIALATRQGKHVQELVTNAYILEFDPTVVVYRYDVDVQIEIGERENVNTLARMVSINKGRRNDSSTVERHELIRLALKRGLEFYRVLEEAQEFEGGAWGVAHDGAALLYANGRLEGALKRHRGGTITLAVHQLPDDARKYLRSDDVTNIHMKISACHDGIGASFKLGDLKGQLTRNRDAMDYSVKQFYEIVTSAQAIDSGEFTFLTAGRLYKNPKAPPGDARRQSKPIGNGMERIDGMVKGCLMIEGEKNGREWSAEEPTAVPAIVADSINGTFWKPGSLLTAVLEMNVLDKKDKPAKHPHQMQWTADTIQKIRRQLRKVRVAYMPSGGGKRVDHEINDLRADVYDNGNTYIPTIDELCDKTEGGQKVRSMDKFSHKTIHLKTWPCIEVKWSRLVPNSEERKREYVYEYFPIELLEILPHQLVPIQRQLKEPEAADVPAVRFKKNTEMLGAFNLMGEHANPWMEAFGIRLKARPLKVESIIRAAPTIAYGGGQRVVVSKDADWRTGGKKFEVGAGIAILVVCYVPLTPEQRRKCFIKEEDWANPIANRIVADAKAKGIKIRHHFVYSQDIHSLVKRMEDIATDRDRHRLDPRKVIFLLIEPLESKHHDELKLLERRFSIPTMHLTAEIAVKVTNKCVMENVLAKLNIKAGGHNYTVLAEKFAEKLWIREGKKTMVVGYDVWHSTGQSRQDKIQGVLPEPSVVGFGFNGGLMADSFVGDYHFQSPLKEQVGYKILNARMKWMLGIFEKARGCLPDVIIITRDGVSDGQFTHAIDELSALREAAREYAVSDARTKDAHGNALPSMIPVPDYDPKFIFIVATKRHHRRFFAQNGGLITNAQAMSLVDNGITSPVLREFFFQTHKPLQGTAKMTRYIILKDDVGTSNDEIQSFMAALCFSHQISANSISIPEPTYQADMWARRGSKNLITYKQWRSRDYEQLAMELDPEDLYEELTKRLAYMGSPLEALRTNA